MFLQNRHMKHSKQSLANFLFEVGILSKTPRSGFHFLGSGKQSVAEHTNRTVFIGYMLAMVDKDIDVTKVMKMCLFHDISEARTSDPNYVHQKYLKMDEQKAIADLVQTIPFGDDIAAILQEYKERKSKESILAKDADNLEWLLSVKEQLDRGNTRAEKWLHITQKRLRTPRAKKLAKSILKTDSDEWWFSDKEDEWWVSRKKKTEKE